MAAEVTSQVAINSVPAIGQMAYVLTYTKVNAADTIALATYCPIKTINFILAQVDAAGADDPTTWTGTTITTSVGTGAGRMLVVGTC